VAIAAMGRRLGVAFLIFLLLDLAFWSVADFRTFQPPSEGSFLERTCCFAISTAGPFAMVINGAIADAPVGCLVTCCIIGALVGVSLRWRRFAVLRVLGYLGVLFWWVVGFGVAAIRID